MISGHGLAQRLSSWQPLSVDTPGLGSQHMMDSTLLDRQNGRLRGTKT